MIVILDFDGTLTAEERQAEPLSRLSLDTLSRDIVGAPREQIQSDYARTRAQLLADPSRHWWQVNGLVASYCDEGAFILNTTTMQTMLRSIPQYAAAVARHFTDAEYDPVVDCTNYLFHRHTAELAPCFRPGARHMLRCLQSSTAVTTLVLTNSLGDKVARHLQTLDIDPLSILGDTRQYDMQPAWTPEPVGPAIAGFPIWQVSQKRHIDLRRPAYYRALAATLTTDCQVTVVADTLSLPGGLALAMGVRFCLLNTPYTPDWCRQVVEKHPLGTVLPSLAALPALLHSWSVA